MDQTTLLIKKSNILVLMIFSTRFTHYIHNKKHGNGTKPGFHATSAFWYISKLLVLASW